jgi:hypothetical protein
MDQLLSDRLIVRFPQLYRTWQGRDMREVWRARQDLECGNGWFDLLWQLRTNWRRSLQRCQKRNAVLMRPSTSKRNSGGLRFSMTKYTPEMERAIRWAEGQSIRICEQCGRPRARLQEEGMIRTHCAEHTPPQRVSWEP